MCFCVCTHAWMRACVVAVSMAEFHEAFHSCLSFLSSHNTSLHHSLRLLRSLFLSFLIDMQQPTSLNGVFYAPWFSALSSSLMFPFLGWLSDVSIYLLILTSLTSQISLFIHTHTYVYIYIYDCESLITCAVHECMLKFT